MPSWPQKEKAIAKAVRDVAKSSGWKVRQGTLTWVEGGLALHAFIFDPGHLRFKVKRVAWNHVVWRVMGLDDLFRKSGSFHFWGPFTAQVPTLHAKPFDAMVNSEEDVAKALLAFAETERGSAEQWRETGFPHLLAASEEANDSCLYVQTEVADLISTDAFRAARDLCEDVIGGRRDCRHTFSGPDPADQSEGQKTYHSFFELTLRWLEREGHVTPRPRPQSAPHISP